MAMPVSTKGTRTITLQINAQEIANFEQGTLAITDLGM